MKYSENQIIRIGEGARLIGVSRKTLYNWWAKYKTFPPPTEYSPGVRGWRKVVFEQALEKMESVH